MFLKFVAGVRYYLSQETLYRGESCKKRIRRTVPAGIHGWPLKFVQHIADATCISPSPASPPGSWLLHLCLLNPSFVIPNRCCIIELRANQYFVCNFLSLPRCKAKLRRRKPMALVAVLEISD